MKKINSIILIEIVRSCICKVHHLGKEVKAIIFDGPLANICMAENLGAKLQQEGIIPMFLNSANQEECYVIYDAYYILKLLRNTFVEHKISYTKRQQRKVNIKVKAQFLAILLLVE